MHNATQQQQTENTATPTDNRWNKQLRDFEEFKIARDALIDWTNNIQTKTLGEVFESKTASFSFQILAILTLQSVGNIGFKWDQHKRTVLRTCRENKVEYNEKKTICNFILTALASK